MVTTRLARPRELAVVRHVEDGLALAVQAREQLEHLLCGDAVEVARRLVADDQLRIGGERARDRDPLLLTTRELGRQVVELVPEPHELEVVPRTLEALALRAAPGKVERQHGVLERRQRRQQLEELEDDPDVRAPPDGQLLLAHLVETLPVDRDLPRRRPVDPGDQVEDRRLAAPRRADDRHHLARAD